ncbi:iron ABC transporter permease [Haematobacter missouriensis]|uniref:Iron ABC transporter permease n=1 Tax=Haematobacter missouriensis TaxID=366616 RepID=A0A212AQ51_9RHOB|nr:iron ABC transporter permease [Haematobacter missouriensis]KFI30214.1 iron ABC transporter permease [Haematobacter missouriensis]OWJ83624.1 iron ABC transporter permease [Haematobacter missouriensis]
MTATTDIRLSRHRAAERRRTGFLAVMALAVVGAFVLDLCTGPAGLSISDLWRALSGDTTLSPATMTIVWKLRLPVAVLALLVGAGLALAGAEMQTVLDNPLASPFTLGVSAAAGFGAALAIVFGLALPGLPPDLAVAGNAFVAAALSIALLQLLVRGREGNAALLVLFGIALVFTFNALLALVQFVAPAEALKQFALWGMGDLAQADGRRVALMAGALVIAVPFSLAASSRLTVLRLGAERAASLGVDPGRLRFMALLRISLLAAAAVATAGTIGFVGLVAPHLARLTVGEDHRHFLPASLLIGALLVSLASAAAKTVIPGVLLPVGIVTSLIGLPVFFVLIARVAR